MDLAMLGTHHPHLTHLVSPFTAESRGRGLSFSFGFEHGLLRLGSMVSRQSCPGAPNQEQPDDHHSNAPHHRFDINYSS